MKNKEIDYDKLSGAIKKVFTISNGDIVLKDKPDIIDLLELKKAVSPINNYITQQLTARFIEKLKVIFPNNFRDEIIEEIQAANEKSNVNANGYDFMLEQESLPFILAEIKANIPYDGKRYGAAQKNGIIKDIKGLLCPKKKGRNNRGITEYYKFQVMLDVEDKEYSSLEAIENFIKNSGDLADKVSLWKNGTQIDNDHVYIIPVEIK